MSTVSNPAVDALNAAVTQLEADFGSLATLQSVLTTAQTTASDASQALNTAQSNLATLNQTIQNDIQAVKDAATKLGAS